MSKTYFEYRASAIIDSARGEKKALIRLIVLELERVHKQGGDEVRCAIKDALRIGKDWEE